MWTATTRTSRQLELIRAFTTTLAQGKQRAWLFGGWGLDARIGHVTRDHGDIEFWVDHEAAADVQPLLVTREQHCWTRSPPRARFDDWLFPEGSFPADQVELAGQPVLAMSLAGMLAMKEQYPYLRNGRPWRAKDVSDIKILRSMPGN